MDNEYLHLIWGAILTAAIGWQQKKAADATRDQERKEDVRIEVEKERDDRLRVLEIEIAKAHAAHDALERFQTEFKSDLTRHLEKQDKILEGILQAIRELDHRKIDRNSVTGQMAAAAGVGS